MCRCGQSRCFSLCVPLTARTAQAQQAADVGRVDAGNVVAAMLDIARVNPNDTLIDLGSGDGRVDTRQPKRSACGVGDSTAIWCRR
jgi:hypothetical protein